ncbi:hypothetical protein [Bdellovibrio sp. ArHS]|uniref:hypothetical protein n=1 Tax=Bdellovibrio sp. ArHS TaxID=1569284 RepID=UPI000AC2AEBD|nr:hypothetical protein [Bdellovibrio sp. ArHS]
MRVVRLFSGSECQSSQLSKEAMILIKTLDNNQGSFQDIAKRCCQAGACPVLFLLRRK